MSQGVWNNTQQNLTDAKYTDVFAISNGLMMTSNFFVGILFDRMGANTISVMGAMVATVGLAGMALAVSSSALNDLLFVA